MTMDVQIPVIVENPLTACGYRKFQLDVLGDPKTVIISVLLKVTRVSKRATTGWLTNFLNFSSPHTK
jgi:hypothetical protein